MGRHEVQWCDRCMTEATTGIAEWDWGVWNCPPKVKGDLCVACDEYVTAMVKKELERNGHF